MLSLKSILVSLFLIIPGFLLSQSAPMKYGKIDVEDFKDSYKIDPDAEAVVLCDFGRSEFIYNNSKEDFQYRFVRHKRIHILKKEGYDYANFVIPYYDTGSDRELISGLKATTYNLENGKINKVKISKDQIFEERVSKNWYQLKFTLPEVKEGSIIEFSYTLVSDYIANFRNWVFQSSIPTLHSEYRAVFPDFFFYQQLQRGAIAYTTEHDKFPEKYTIQYRNTSGEIEVGRAQNRSYDINSVSDKYRWVGKDIPGLKREPYITTMSDYYTRIDFMLSSIQFKGQPVRDRGTSYPKLNNSLMKSDYFGGLLQRDAFIKDKSEAMKSKYNDPVERAIAIFYDWRDVAIWNGGLTIYPKESLRKAYNESGGNIADINMTLVAYLRSSGINADPVVLSTRSNGKMHPVYPDRSKLNYVLAYVDLGDRKILMDASDRDRPFYLLPENVMNGQGWRVSETNPGWVKLSNNESETTKTSVKIAFKEDGEIGGSMDIKLESALAFNNLKEFAESEEDYKKQFKFAEWDINEMEVKQDASEMMNLKHHFELDYSGDPSGTILYISPVFVSNLNENPFKQEKRTFPVDYPCQVVDSYSFSMELPQGYVIEELPENKLLSLPNNGGRFTYSAIQNGNSIMITVQRKISKTDFTATEYASLREFYIQAVAKCSEQIVLKKKS